MRAISIDSEIDLVTRSNSEQSANEIQASTNRLKTVMLQEIALRLGPDDNIDVELERKLKEGYYDTPSNKKLHGNPDRKEMQVCETSGNPDRKLQEAEEKCLEKCKAGESESNGNTERKLQKEGRNSKTELSEASGISANPDRKLSEIEDPESNEEDSRDPVRPINVELHCDATETSTCFKMIESAD